MPSALPRRLPEREGVRSGAILAFIDALEAKGMELHSLMILRHGAVVAEGWWAPHESHVPHNVYSVSKTFLSAAIGLAVADGRLKTSSRLVDLFPEALPDTVDERLARLQIRHLLMMAAGHDGADFSTHVLRREDWVRAFFREPMVSEPGERFVYQNSASYMLSATIQKLYGKSLAEFLDERLFAPLGIATPHWDCCPKGVSAGGWGLFLPTEALARFGQLYLQRGRWGDLQLIPAVWIEESTAFHIQQLPDVPIAVRGHHYDDPQHALAALRSSSDWYQGYGYQIWRGRRGDYRADGAAGQFIMVLPDQEMVIVTTASMDPARFFDCLDEHLLSGVSNSPLPEGTGEQEKLRAKIESLALPVPAGEMTASGAARIADRWFALSDNSLGAQALRLRWEGDRCDLTLERAHGPIDIPLGFERWVTSRVQAPDLTPWNIMGKTVHASEVAIAGAFAWSNARTLILHLRFIESAQHYRVTVRVAEDALTFENREALGRVDYFSGLPLLV